MLQISKLIKILQIWAYPERFPLSQGNNSTPPLVYHVSFLRELKTPRVYGGDEEKILRWLTGNGFLSELKQRSYSFSDLLSTWNNDTQHSCFARSISLPLPGEEKSLWKCNTHTLVGTRTYVPTHICQLTANQDKRSVALGGGKILHLTMESHTSVVFEALGGKNAFGDLFFLWRGIRHEVIYYFYSSIVYFFPCFFLFFFFPRSY